MDSSPSNRGIRAGVLWGLLAPSRDLTPESLRGSWSIMILPSVLPAMRLRTSGGLHRFEPVEWNGIAPAPGSLIYPTRYFATLGPFVDCYSRRGRRGRGHFCRALHVAVETGLSHPDPEASGLAYSL